MNGAGAHHPSARRPSVIQPPRSPRFVMERLRGGRREAFGSTGGPPPTLTSHHLRRWIRCFSLFFRWTWDGLHGRGVINGVTLRPVDGNKQRCGILCHFPGRARIWRFITARRKSRRWAITVYHC